MGISAEAIYGLVQLGRFANETIALYQNGKLSDEELNQRWEKVRARIDTAEDLWKQSGK